MLNKIKNFLNFSKKSNDNFIPFSDFGSLLNIGNKNTLSKTELLNLFTGYSYVCISAVSEGIAGLDRKLFFAENREEEEKNHEYIDLITNSFLEEVVGYLEITGICYIRKVFFGNKIKSLEVLRSDLVYRMENGSYNYNFNGKIYNFLSEEIFEIKHFSPLKNGLGFSPLQALGIQQKMDEIILRWNMRFFENNASSGTTLQTDMNLTNDQKEYLAQKWKSEFMGVENSHKVVVLDNGLKQEKSEIGQKEMDFVNQRLQIRDEIFTIFRVPKVVVGITDGVGYTDRMVGKSNFAEFKLKPIALKIQEALNKNIFEGIGFFKFINVIPVDTTQLLEDYRIGAITLDEYRLKRGYLNVKNGNKNISGEVFEYENNGDYKKEKRNFDLEKILKNISEKSENKLENRWKEKIKRSLQYEKDFKNNLLKIFDLQEKEVLKNLEKKYLKKSLEDLEEMQEEDLFSDTAFLIIFQQYFYNYYKNLLKVESEIAKVEGKNESLNFEKIEKYIGELISKFALDINKTTKTEILEIIKSGVRDGLSYEEIKTNVTEKFEEYKKSRIEKIARTEVTRGVNKAREETWRQNPRVTHKEWYAPQDERGCPFCKSKHGQRKKIGESFDKNDYETVYGPPFHPNCRCDLVPILEYLKN